MDTIVDILTVLLIIGALVRILDAIFPERQEK